jgi:RNase P protein component
MQEGSYDLIFMGRKGVQEVETAEIEQAVLTLLQSANKLIAPKEAP